jgi:predicted ATP-dependent endonuclease of OLD family
MNLFAMVFNLHLIFDSFKKIHVEHENQADINLLFIEEPEAHTHPQMQYVFIKNIKTLLKEIFWDSKGVSFSSLFSSSIFFIIA